MTVKKPEGITQTSASPGPGEASEEYPHTLNRRLALTSRESLVSEAVRAALASRGFEAFSLRWPGLGGESVASRQLSALWPDCLLLMVDLEPPARLREAQALVSQVPVRSLLLTGTPMGPLWGAMLESGVSAVLPTTTQLDEIVERLTDLMLDRPVMSEHLKQELLRAWRTVRTEQEVLIARMKSLTPREQTVLRMLYAGDGVRTISDLMGVTEATVRSQVKSVLRKLDVNSQLAAVAAFGSLREDPDLQFSWPDE